MTTNVPPASTISSAEPVTPAALEWPFPEPNTDEMLIHLTDPRFAISFAATKLQDFEAASFLRDWLAGNDLRPWLDALEYDRNVVQGEPEEGSGLLLRE